MTTYYNNENIKTTGKYIKGKFKSYYEDGKIKDDFIIDDNGKKGKIYSINGLCAVGRFDSL